MNLMKSFGLLLRLKIPILVFFQQKNFLGNNFHTIWFQKEFLFYLKCPENIQKMSGCTFTRGRQKCPKNTPSGPGPPGKCPKDVPERPRNVLKMFSKCPRTFKMWLKCSKLCGFMTYSTATSNLKTEAKGIQKGIKNWFPDVHLRSQGAPWTPLGRPQDVSGRVQDAPRTLQRRAKCLPELPGRPRPPQDSTRTPPGHLKCG